MSAASTVLPLSRSSAAVARSGFSATPVMAIDAEAALPARSCLMLAVQADGAQVTSVEGLAKSDGTLHPIQAAFHAHHGLQCGFCTPGMLTTLAAFLAERPDAGEADIREAISGNICRCTGYENIVDAALAAGKAMRGGS